MMVKRGFQALMIHHYGLTIAQMFSKTIYAPCWGAHN